MVCQSALWGLVGLFSLCLNKLSDPIISAQQYGEKVPNMSSMHFEIHSEEPFRRSSGPHKKCTYSVWSFFYWAAQWLHAAAFVSYGLPPIVKKYWFIKKKKKVQYWTSFIMLMIALAAIMLKARPLNTAVPHNRF